MKKNNKTLKRFLAFLLCAAMLITYMPSSVYTLADESADTPEVATDADSGDSGAEAKKEAPKKAPAPAAAPAEQAEPAPAAEPEAAAEPEESQVEEAQEPETPETRAGPSDDSEAAAEEAAEEATEETSEEAAPEGEEAVEEEAVEEEKEDEDKLNEKELTFTGKANSVYVKVVAQPGTFPEGTTMKVVSVSKGAVKDAVEGALDDVNDFRAVDITFYADGKEVQPKKNVSVKLTTSAFDTEEDLNVVHIKDSGAAEVMNLTSASDTAAQFRSDSFSVYVVVDTGEDARLKVVFHKVDGTTAEMLINKRQISHINQYIYDPGYGTPAEGVQFKGWTTKENYTAADVENAMTIADVRTEVTTELNKGVEDGDVFDVYAMGFKTYTVTFQDERGIMVKTDQVLVNAASSETPKYTVELDYTPYPTGEEGVVAEFMGWQQIKPQISGELKLYQIGDNIDLTETEFVLKAYTEEGHWLVFEENLSNASYTEPQFVAIGKKPTVPANPTRSGYTFDGWYTEDDSEKRDGKVKGSEFNFDSVLTENKVVYGKWTPASTADYKVVFWLENKEGTGYDYSGTTLTVSGATVGNNTYNITAIGSGNDRYARVYRSNNNYNNYDDFTGFHLSTVKPNANGYEDPKPVAAEGNTIINVYYDRNMITYNFRYSNSDIKSFTGRYGSDFKDWPDPGNGYVWGIGSGWSRVTFPLPVTEYNPAVVSADNTSTDITFTLSDFDQRYTLYVYKQTEAGEWSYTDDYLIATAPLAGGYQTTWTPTETYIGYTLDSYRRGTTGTWTKCTPTTRIEYSSDLYLRYTRDQYKIDYNDGIFEDGSHNPVPGIKETNILPEETVYYEANIASFNKTPSKDGFVFLGWYDNEDCAGDPYTFDKMPAHNVTLYAKWGIREYAINLHANDSTDDPIKYNREDQLPTFYTDEGTKVGDVGGKRIYSDLVGWYSDEAMTHAFNFEAMVVNQATIEKYGKLYSPSEIDPDYPTTVGELNLYAKWRSKLIGAEGIDVVYDAAGGTNAPTDDNKYVDQAEAVAGAGATAKDTDNYVFSHWAVQKWNGTEFVDDVKVFPGESFDVLAANAKITEKGSDTAVDPRTLDPNKKYTYTVQLKAVYIEKDKEIKTFINWYNNYDGGLVDKSENLKINEAVNIPAAPTRDGYEFKGWIRGIEEDGTTTSLTDLYITYDGAYKYGGKTVTQVACDENLVGDGTQHHAMYAKWEAVDVNYSVEFYYQNDNGEGYTKDDSLTATRQAKTDTTANVTDADKAQTKGGKYKLAEDDSTLSATVAGDGSTVLKLYFELNQADVTVHHYLKGTTTKVADDVTATPIIGETYTAEPVTSYQGKTLTLDEAASDDLTVTVAVGGNVINLYYTLPLKITAKTDSKEYDGTPLNGEYTVTGALDSDATAINAALGTAPSITHVAEGPKTYLTETEQAAITGIPGYYTVSYTSGTLTITPATLTITTQSGEKEYDGKALTKPGTDTGYKHGEKADFTVTGSQTEVGESNNTYTILFKGEEGASEAATAVRSDYTISETVGKLKVTQSSKELKIVSADGEWTYDGNEHKKPEYTVTYGEESYTVKVEDEATTAVATLSTGDKVTITPAAAAKITHVADTTVDNEFTYVVDHANQFKTITKKAGKLTVKPATLTVKTESANKVYDGKALTAGGSIDGFVKPTGGSEETATFTVTGSQTAVGDSPNSYSIKWDGTAVETDYTVSEDLGTLKVTASTTSLVIASSTKSWEYDGTAHTDPVYTVTYGEESGTATAGAGGKYTYKLSTGDTITITPAATATVTHVADKTVKNAFSYELTNAGNYSDVKKTEGDLSITPATLTVTTGNGSKIYDGTALTAEGSVTGYKNGEKADFTVTGTITNVGKTDNTYTLVFAGEEGASEAATAVRSDYTISESVGELEVTRRTITYISGSSSKVYDGVALTDNNMKVEGEFAPGEGATYEITGTQTLVGTSDNVFTVTPNEGTDIEKNYVIARIYGTLTVTDGTNPPDDPVADDLVVTKTAEDKAYALGETVTFTITATNIYSEARDITLTEIPGVTLAQSKFEGVAGGASKSTTATYTITEADILNGSFTNTVTAKIGESLTKKAEATVRTEDLDTTLTVNKKISNAPADGKAYKLGETIEYTITVTNDGNATYTNVKINDEKTGFSTTIASLGIGESKTFETSHEVTEADIAAGFFKNVVTAKGDPIPDPKDPENPKTPEGEDSVTTGDKDDPDGPNPPLEDLDTTLTVNKAITNEPADGKAYKLGETIEYKITVTNDGNVTYKNIVVKDEGTGLDETITSLAPKATETFTTKHVVTEADILAGSYTNTATAKADPIPDPKDPENPKTPEGKDTVTTGDEDDPDGPTPPIEDLNTTLTVNKKISSKPADGKAYKLGETIKYTITVTNDGNVTYKNIVVKDEGTGLDETITSLAPGATKTFTTSHVVNEDDILAGKYTNTATAKADPVPDPKDPDNPKTPEGEDTVTTGDKDDPDGPNPPVEPKNGHLSLKKETTSKARRSDGKYVLGETITYKITATNDGNLTLTDVKVVDELTKEAWTVESLAPGKEKTFTTKHVVTEADILAGEVLNVATATVKSPDDDNPNPPVDPGKDPEPTEGPKPGISVTKTANRTRGLNQGDTVRYTVTVKNTGNVTLKNINVTDSLVKFAGNKGKNITLAPGASTKLTYRYTVTAANVRAGRVVNRATAQGTAPNGASVSGSDRVTARTAANGGGNPGGGNPGGGNPGGPAVTPAAPADGDAAVVPDEPVPEAEPEVEIEEPETPLAAGAWALVNLICAAATALGAIVALFRKKEEDDEDEDGEGEAKPKTDDEEDEDDNRGKKMLASKIAGAVAGVAGPVAFMLTEDMSLPMQMVDKWTLLMAVILAAQIVAAVFNKKASELDDEDEDEAVAAAN